MKLTTILRHGEPRPALIITNDGLRCQFCLDLIAVDALLPAHGKDWRVTPAPRGLRQIIAGGAPALDNLKRLQDALLTSISDKNQALFGDALLPPAEVRWLPPLPDCPLFITFHDNGITLWRDRSVPVKDRAVITRVPMCRLHPLTSTLGHLEPLIFPRHHTVQYGNELTVVIAPGGKNIAYADAHKHIWGITNANDATRSPVWPLHFGRTYAQMERHEQESRGRLGRASDAASSYGPWITTIDEVPNVHDVLLYSWGPDGGYSRAHTSSYTMGPVGATAYFSRFITLPPGTLYQFGAAGVDGAGRVYDTAVAHTQTCEMFMEHVGTLTNPVWCEEKIDSPRAAREGFYGVISRQRGIDLARYYEPEEQPFPHGTRSIWSLMYNDKTTARDARYAPDRQRHYEIYPRTTLSTGQPVELPLHAGRVLVTCELAAVIGPRSAARLAPDEVHEYLAGLTILVGLRDCGIGDELPNATGREAIFARILGRWADGFNAVRPEITPFARVGDLANRAMLLSLPGVGEVTTNTSDYLLDHSSAISLITKEITLLPGDIVSLGPAGQWLEIPAQPSLPPDAVITASIEGVGQLTVPLVDLRGPHPARHEVM